MSIAGPATSSAPPPTTTAILTTPTTEPATSTAAAPTATPAPRGTATQEPPTASTRPATALANRTAWDGTEVPVQAGTVVAVSVPALAPEDAGQTPSVSLDGLPAPVATALPDGAVAVRIAVPATAAVGLRTLTARWPSGRQATLRLRIAATEVLATGLGEPDDVTAAPDGSVLYTDLKANVVGQILADGRTRTVVRGLSIPEGLAVLGADTLLIGDQGSNRVLQWGAQAGLRSLLQLPVRAGVDGIDGLGSAVIDGQAVALVPDSANGRILLLRLDTLATTVVPGRWQRPVAATVHAGILYLVDEYGGRLWQGPPDGPLTPLGPALHLPDDVVVAADGSVFVNELSGNIVRILPNGSATRPLTGLRNPQGLALDSAENLIIAESDSGDIVRSIRSCAPLLLGSAALTLHAGGPALAIPLGSDCAPGTATPTFSMASGGLWPIQNGERVDWTAAGAATAALPNGIVAQLRAAGAGSALLELDPPAVRPAGAAALSVLAVQMHLGARVAPLQIAVTLAA